jgi:hypothetical protein
MQAMKPVAKLLSKPESDVDFWTLPWCVPECTRLTTEYERLKDACGIAVDLLFKIGYQVTDAEHKKLKAATEDARIDLEVARLELERHARTHSSAIVQGADF